MLLDAAEPVVNYARLRTVAERGGVDGPCGRGRDRSGAGERSWRIPARSEPPDTAERIEARNEGLASRHYGPRNRWRREWRDRVRKYGRPHARQCGDDRSAANQRPVSRAHMLHARNDRRILSVTSTALPPKAAPHRSRPAAARHPQARRNPGSAATRGRPGRARSRPHAAGIEHLVVDAEMLGEFA